MYSEITLLEKLSEENSDLKQIVNLMEDIIESDKKIVNLQRENIEHLKMIANDRQVTINQMNEERWAVRKLDEDRYGYKHEFNHLMSDNISKNFTEDRIADMDCGDPHWPDGYKCG